MEEENQRIEDNPREIMGSDDFQEIFFGSEASNNSERLRDPYLADSMGADEQNIDKVAIEYEGQFPQDVNNLNSQ